MDNLRFWNQFKMPPQSALKKIQAGRLKGKSDISPQWRFMAMTETFGPVGIGWKYTIDRLWTEPGTDGQVCAFALVTVQVKTDGEWSEPIPGIGGSMLIEKESRGLHTSDEGFKMAVTDGLSVAFKSLGVAADVYMGLLDDSKYQRTAPPQQQPRQPVTQAPPAPPKIAVEEVKKEMDGAFDYQEMKDIYKNRLPMMRAHYSAKELAEVDAYGAELKQSKFAA